MTASLDFSYQFGARSNGTDAESGTDITITADVDDGVISVGDEVTVTNLNSLVSNYSGISEGGTAYYHGAGTFNSDTGYVFSTDSTLADPSNVLVVFNSVDDDFAVLLAIRSFAQDTDSVTLDDVPACFAAGTLITTPNGACAVEDLKIGDVVLNADGQTVPVKWIGKQTVSTRFGPAERLRPVRISTGALGLNVPNCDLTLTADHALLIENVLCNAAALVNGTTIDFVPLSQFGETFTVYHVETEGHEIILANGAPAETFIDNVSRRCFDNFKEYSALYEEPTDMSELPYPRVMAARQLPMSLRTEYVRKVAV